MAQTVKSLPAVWETRVRSLVCEDPLEKEMATHFSILAWKTPWVFATPCTVAHQAPPSIGFSRLEYWSGLPFLPGDLPNSRIKLRSPALQADSLPSEPPGTPLPFVFVILTTPVSSDSGAGLGISYDIDGVAGGLYFLYLSL